MAGPGGSDTMDILVTRGAGRPSQLMPIPSPPIVFIKKFETSFI